MGPRRALGSPEWGQALPEAVTSLVGQVLLSAQMASEFYSGSIHWMAAVLAWV
jgi:hypothetical protein